MVRDDGGAGVDQRFAPPIARSTRSSTPGMPSACRAPDRRMSRSRTCSCPSGGRSRPGRSRQAASRFGGESHAALPPAAAGARTLCAVRRHAGCAQGAYDLVVGAARKRNATTTGLPWAAARLCRSRWRRRARASTPPSSSCGGPATTPWRLPAPAARPPTRTSSATAAMRSSPCGSCLEAVDILMAHRRIGRPLPDRPHAAAVPRRACLQCPCDVLARYPGRPVRPACAGLAGPAPIIGPWRRSARRARIAPNDIKLGGSIQCASNVVPSASWRRRRRRELRRPADRPGQAVHHRLQHEPHRPAGAQRQGGAAGHRRSGKRTSTPRAACSAGR